MNIDPVEFIETGRFEDARKALQRLLRQRSGVGELFTSSSLSRHSDVARALERGFEQALRCVELGQRLDHIVV